MVLLLRQVLLLPVSSSCFGPLRATVLYLRESAIEHLAVAKATEPLGS